MRTIYLLCFLLFINCGKSLCQNEMQARNQQNQQNQEQSEQERREAKGSYFTVAGSVGANSFNYKLNSLGEKGSRRANIGYGVDLKYSYYFDNHWGLSTGIGITHYSTTGKLIGGISDGKYYNLGMLTDDDLQERPREFQLRARLSNLEEKQTAFLFEVPIIGMYQTRFGEEENWGMYAGLGLKLQFPVNSKFKIQKGQNSQLNVSGYYAGIPTDMGAPANPPVPQHGYGTITDPNASLDWNDKSKLKMGVAGTAELGIMVDLGNEMDLLLGGYIDYGFTNMKKKKDQGLFTAPSVYHPTADNNIGKGITYNGMLNSDITGKIKPIAFGAKVALRFKL